MKRSITAAPMALLAAAALALPASAQSTAKGTGTTVGDGDTIMVVDVERAPLRRPMVERDGYVPVAAADVSADDLEDADVYGIGDDEIGEVEDLVIGADGALVEAMVLDIGGFLGLGEHRVALSPDEVQIMREQGGDDLRVYVDATQGELEALPEYAGS